MSSSLRKRLAYTPLVAVSCAGLIGSTVSASPAEASSLQSIQGVDMSNVIIVQARDVDAPINIHDTPFGRGNDTNAPILLQGDPDGLVELPGKDTKPANPKIIKAQPGYNTYQHFAREGDNPDAKDLDVANGFTPKELYTIYRADIPEKVSYVNVLAGFTQARTNKAVMSSNTRTVLAINNNAGLVQIQRAVLDSNEENVVSMSDAMGGRLGKIFGDLYEDGKLPKLFQLLGGNMSRGYNFMNATGLEKVYFRNERPFSTYPTRVKYYYEDMDDLREDDGYKGLSLSYPSGHTNRAFIKGTLLALMLPELAPQILTRASEVGYNRMVMGVHYPLDVIGGRMAGQASVAWHLADPRFRPLVVAAGKQLRAELEKKCGTTVLACSQQGQKWLSTSESVRVYTERMNYRLPRMGKAGQAYQVPRFAADLLFTAFPNLTQKQREQVLVASALDSGYPLDVTGPDGGWQRLNLAKAMAAKVRVQNGKLIITFPAGS